MFDSYFALAEISIQKFYASSIKAYGISWKLQISPKNTKVIYFLFSLYCSDCFVSLQKPAIAKQVLWTTRSRNTTNESLNNLNSPQRLGGFAAKETNFFKNICKKYGALIIEVDVKVRTEKKIVSSLLLDYLLPKNLYL